MTNLKLIKSKKFGKVKCDFYSKHNRNEVWMTRRQIGKALNYSQPNNAIKKIHSRHKNRLNKFSRVAQIDTSSGRQKTYLYNRKGIMEVCRWSEKPKADQFIDWVWDIIDEIMTTGSYSLPGNEIEDLIIMQAKSVKELKQKVNRHDEKIDEQHKKIESIKDTLLHTDEEWREWLNNQLNKIAFKSGKYQEIRRNSYNILENRAQCRLEVRLTNLKGRLKKAGAKQSKINKANKLDVIEEDTRLKEIYTGVVKELAIKYLDEIKAPAYST
ncbi:MAG: BRO family protein [Candidatus Woesearchaeota archaeon]